MTDWVYFNGKYSMWDLLHCDQYRALIFLSRCSETLTISQFGKPRPARPLSDHFLCVSSKYSSFHCFERENWTNFEWNDNHLYRLGSICVGGGGSRWGETGWSTVVVDQSPATAHRGWRTAWQADPIITLEYSDTVSPRSLADWAPHVTQSATVDSPGNATVVIGDNPGNDFNGRCHVELHKPTSTQQMTTRLTNSHSMIK